MDENQSVEWWHREAEMLNMITAAKTTRKQQLNCNVHQQITFDNRKMIFKELQIEYWED